MKEMSLFPLLGGVINLLVAIGINNRLSYVINGGMAIVCFIAAIAFFLIGLKEDRDERH